MNQVNILQLLLKAWCNYKSFVENVTKSSKRTVVKDISYWRDKLFTQFILYSIPCSLVALIPAIYGGLREGYVFIISFDVITVTLIIAISLNKRLSLNFRKGFVATTLYFLAVVLIFNLGSFGPGVFYLLVVTIFLSLIFPGKVAYWSIVAHILTCTGFAWIVENKLFGSALIEEYTLNSWIAYSSNLIFSSLICTLLISKIINGLEKTIISELRLKNKLELEAAERTELNEKLKESEGHYKSLFFQNPSPMWIYDPESLHFMQVNDVAVKNYGFSRAEFSSMTLKDIRPESSIDQLIDEISIKVKRGIPNRCTTQHRTKDNKAFAVDVCGNTIEVSGKQARLVIARDISEQISYINAIEEQNQKLQEIAFIQSHLVRAPLARIMGLTYLILRNKDEKPDPKLLEYLDQSAKDFDQIIQTITDNTAQFDLSKELNLIK